MATIIMKQGVIGAKTSAMQLPEKARATADHTLKATEEKAADRHAGEIVAAGR